MAKSLWSLLAQLENPFPVVQPDSSSVENVLNIVFSVTGAISFLMVTIGGLRYVLSHGDPQQANKAKNTILYALVGLGVSLLAAVIVNFVTTEVTGP